jgi:hypothetical protein
MTGPDVVPVITTLSIAKLGRLPDPVESLITHLTVSYTHLRAHET